MTLWSTRGTPTLQQAEHFVTLKDCECAETVSPKAMKINDDAARALAYAMRARQVHRRNNNNIEKDKVSREAWLVRRSRSAK